MAYLFVSATWKSDEWRIWQDSPHWANMELEKSETGLWNIDNKDTITNKGGEKPTIPHHYPKVMGTNIVWKTNIKWNNLDMIFCKMKSFVQIDQLLDITRISSAEKTFSLKILAVKPTVNIFLNIIFSNDL